MGPGHPRRRPARGGLWDDPVGLRQRCRGGRGLHVARGPARDGRLLSAGRPVMPQTR
ncbi:hypothetical protein ACFFX0_27950 [Citricoccus parietis]|uniref:Uncharacterized protein n=1 Tax=Citricoccus parietis TaxID=592307 RepID=A0ABV5G789_9MICC